MGLERKEMDKAVIFVVKSFDYGKDANGAAASRWVRIYYQLLSYSSSSLISPAAFFSLVRFLFAFFLSLF